MIKRSVEQCSSDQKMIYDVRELCGWVAAADGYWRSYQRVAHTSANLYQRWTF